MTFALRARRSLLLALAALGCVVALIAPTTASAAITAAQTAPACDSYNSLTNWGPRALTLPQFNAARGTLTAVTVTRVVSMRSDYSVTSKDNEAQSIPISVNGTATLDLATRPQLAATLNQSRTLVFPGKGTQTGTLGPSDSTTTDIMTNLADWTGVGTVSAFGSANASQNSQTTGNATVDINTSASIQLCVVYSYTYDVKVCIGDYVWVDVNTNGIQDAGEPPVAGRDIVVRDGSGLVLGTATTDANGLWNVCNLEPNIACDITVDLPAGWSITAANVGTNRSIDSNGAIRGVDAWIACITPTSGSDLTFDVGIHNDAPQAADTPRGVPGMRVAKAAKSKTVASRGKVVFTVSVTNIGKATAVNIAVCDVPPTQLAFITRPKGSYTSHGKLCWKVKSLKPKGRARFRYVMRASNVAAKACVTNAATAVPRTGRAGSAKARTCIKPGAVGRLLLAG
jgi:uncharacterized repeat protein (TIGR01451 family)